MRKLFIILLLIPCFANATRYYVDATLGGDTNNGLGTGTAWQSIAKVNSSMASFIAGDVISFKCGEVYYGSLSITKSGTSGNPIIFNSYGAGAKPVFTGFVLATGFTNVSGSLWQSAAIYAAYKPKMVTIGGVNTAMGRYPNASDPLSGYLILESASGDTSITDNQLTNTPNWTGATVAIRSYDYVIKVDSITNHTGTNIKTVGGDGGVNPGVGYIVINSINTLDQPNEWYFNNSTKAITVFSAAAPVNVKVATIDTVINTKLSSYITIRDLAIEGANKSGIGINTGGLAGGTNGISIINCDISFSGQDAIYGTHTSHFLVDSSTVKYSNNNGVYIENEGGVGIDAVVKNTKVVSIGLFPGMVTNGTNCQAITLFDSVSLVQNCSIDSVGFNGVSFYYNHSKVKSNLINHYGMTKGDGAGVYTFNAGVGNNDREITDNIIINGVGVSDGSLNHQKNINGVYTDDNVSGVLIARNTIVNAPYAGLYLHNNTNLKVRDNLVYNCPVAAVMMVHDSYGGQITNVDLLHNKLFSVGTTPQIIATTINDDLDNFGLRDSNMYVNDTQNKFQTSKRVSGTDVPNTYTSLSAWKAAYSVSSKDAQATEFSMPTSNVRFEYNASTGVLPILLNSYNYTDALLANYPGLITLQPYTSAILFKGVYLSSDIIHLAGLKIVP